MTESILNISKKMNEQITVMRRELHKYPEIGGTLPQTRKIVCDRLDRLGITYKLNNNDDGLIVDIKGKQEGKTLAFRADMDGLHITEDTNVEYCSEIPGQMHGCGHDAHTAILLGVASYCAIAKEYLK